MSSGPAGYYSGSRQRVYFGKGCTGNLSQVLEEAGVSRSLVVTTVRSFPSVDRVCVAAGEGRVAAIYDDGKAHAPRQCAMDALAQLRTARADSIIAVGGGSAVDIARGVMILDFKGGDFSTDEKVLDLDFHKKPETYLSKSLSRSLKREVLPLFTVTTTLSQAEFNIVAGITNEVTGEKEIFELERGKLMPECAFLDGDMTVHTPDRLWVGSGVKAMETGIVRYLSYSDDQPFLDPILLGAIAQLHRLLPQSHFEPRNVEIRQRLQLACWQAFGQYMVPVDNSVPLADDLIRFGSAARHQLGGRYGSAHGELAGVILPAVLEFNRAGTRSRQQRLAELLGASSPEELSTETWPRFVAALGLPSTLGGLDAGIEIGAVPDIVEAMVSERPSLSNRRDELVEILTRLV